jgi:protein TonB
LRDFNATTALSQQLNLNAMETKKSNSADLSKKSAFFFSIGLLVAMSAVLMAFEWKQTATQLVSCNFGTQDEFEKLIEIPITEVKQPEPKILVAPKIIEVDELEPEDEMKFVFNSEFTQDTVLPQIVATPEVAPEDTDEPFILVEDPATPIGGISEFYKYVGSNIRYPSQARRMQTGGRVYVEFVIAKDGSITDAHVVKGIGAGCDEEALRVVQSAPAWKPGKQRGKPVRQKIVIPIIFKVN